MGSSKMLPLCVVLLLLAAFTSAYVPTDDQVRINGCRPANGYQACVNCCNAITNWDNADSINDCRSACLTEQFWKIYYLYLYKIRCFHRNFEYWQTDKKTDRPTLNNPTEIKNINLLTSLVSVVLSFIFISYNLFVFNIHGKLWGHVVQWSKASAAGGGYYLAEV